MKEIFYNKEFLFLHINPKSREQQNLAFKQVKVKSEISIKGAKNISFLMH